MLHGFRAFIYSRDDACLLGVSKTTISIGALDWGATLLANGRNKGHRGLFNRSCIILAQVIAIARPKSLSCLPNPPHLSAQTPLLRMELKRSAPVSHSLRRGRDKKVRGYGAVKDAGECNGPSGDGGTVFRAPVALLKFKLRRQATKHFVRVRDPQIRAYTSASAVRWQCACSAQRAPSGLDQRLKLNSSFGSVGIDISFLFMSGAIYMIYVQSVVDANIFK